MCKCVQVCAPRCSDTGELIARARHIFCRCGPIKRGEGAYSVDVDQSGEERGHNDHQALCNERLRRAARTQSKKARGSALPTTKESKLEAEVVAPAAAAEPLHPLLDFDNPNHPQPETKGEFKAALKDLQKTFREYVGEQAGLMAELEDLKKENERQRYT
eukprot:1181402-Prorocentrum_minimum.AAC.2